MRMVMWFENSPYLLFVKSATVLEEPWCIKGMCLAVHNSSRVYTTLHSILQCCCVKRKYTVCDQYIWTFVLCFQKILATSGCTIRFTLQVLFWKVEVPRMASAMCELSNPRSWAASACAPYTSLCREGVHNLSECNQANAHAMSSQLPIIRPNIIFENIQGACWQTISDTRLPNKYQNYKDYISVQYSLICIEWLTKMRLGVY